MKAGELKYSLKNLIHRRLRSFLSVLSILIGITAIFAIVSFGLGMQNYIDEIAGEAGIRTIYIMSKGAGAPGMDDTFGLVKEEVDMISKIKGVDDITGVYAEGAEIEHKDEIKYSFAIGFDPDKIGVILGAFAVDIEKGRNLKKGDMRKVVLGYNYMIDGKIFKRAVSVGDKIEVNSEKFEVVGFFTEVGTPQDDSQIYLPLKAMEEVFGLEEKFGFAIVFANRAEDVSKVAERIEDELRKKRGQEEGEEDFYAMTFEDTMEVYGNVLAVLNGILALIALVSLAVAGVNIMNTMYTAVIERTREIGVMKAVGAKNSNIMLIFVIESGLLGTIGGIGGILVGYAVARTGGYAVSAAGYGFLQPIFPWYLIAGCILFAFVVGAMSGLLPAYQASQLKPVDALRYE